MTFDDVESSRTLAQPLELYLFESESRTFAYCNGDDDYTYDGMTYLAVPISRTSITSSGTLDRATVTVTIADTTELAATLRGYPVSSVLVMTIRQGHPDLPQFLVAWAGRVLSAKGGNDGTRALTCQPASTALKRNGLRRMWQYGCPHALYGPHCRAAKGPATVETVPTGTNGSTVFLSPGWNGARLLASYPGGLMQWTNANGETEVRTILRVTDVSIVLGGPASFAQGTTVSVSYGCDHTMNDCRNLHVPSDEADYGGGNIRNYGGQPFIPTTNPIGIARNY